MKKHRYPLVVLLAFTILLSSCNSMISEVISADDSNTTEESINSQDSVEAFLHEVDNNNVLEAIEIYRDDINGQTDLSEEVNIELITRLEDAISDYNSGLISDTQATVIFDTISSLYILRETDISALRENLNQLIASKSAFNSAETFFDSGDYYNAYQQYMRVIPNDTNYSNAVSSASESIDLYVSGVETQVEEYKSVNDYYSAITTIRTALELIPNNQTLLTEQTILETEYIQYSLDTAASTHQDGNNYEGAINIIQTARTLVNDASLDEAYEYYLSFYPYWLLNDEPLFSTNSTYYRSWRATDMDNYENTYDYGLRFDWCSSHTNSFTYILNGQFNRLSGLWVVAYEARNEDDGYYSQIRIYGDGVLLYESPVMGGQVQPAAFDIDITGVNELTFELELHAGGIEHLYAGLVDVYVSRTL